MKHFMPDKEQKQREETCPFGDEIKEMLGMKETIKLIADKQTDMDNRQIAIAGQIQETFDRLFVQNGGNQGKDCLAVQVQKNSNWREEKENEESEERRNKWRRLAFYATLAGILLSNLWMIVQLFIIEK